MDAGLADLIGRRDTRGNFTLQISTWAHPKVIRGLLPLVAQQGVLEVCDSKRRDHSYCA